MLKFVARVFVAFLEVFLWLNLIGSAITGAVMGYMGAEAAGEGPTLYIVIGLVLGAVVGIISNIVFGGIIVIFVNMGKDITELRDDVKKLSTSLASGGKSP